MFNFTPVSASMINGFVVTSKILFIFESLFEISNASISGLPISVESVKELDQKPSNSFCLPSDVRIAVFSAIMAEIGL